MANGGEKSWNRPWSMEEMIENAENWSLAGDVALLNTLKAYSENLFKRSVSISDNVDGLLQNLDEVSLRLSLSQNDFQSLRNTQFIENRVYEDDETVDFNEAVKPEQPLPTEEEKEKLMKESVLEGLRVMNKYYDKIEVSVSDTEDEESHKSYVLRPKDLYAHRPLPLVIGTPEWYKTWHVGLASSSSESESDKVSETYSDSESGDDLPKDLIKGSETSSDLDLSSRTSENRPVANSTFNEASRRAADEESDGQGSFPAKTPISSRSFAEQLAAKLGDVISEREDISKEINRKPIQPPQKNKFADVLFADEPPPLDDLEDTVLPKSAKEGLFSGGQGLFDDKDDDLFWGQKTKEPSTKPAETEEKAATSPKTSQVSKAPFDSDSESSDDDIFAIKPKKPAKQPFVQPYSTTAPLFDEEPPELEVSKKLVEDALKKKPVGGVSIFGKTDILNTEILKSRQQDSVDSSKAPEPPTVRSEQNVRPKHLNLFDEDEAKAVETAPAPTERKPAKISLFDDVEAKPETSAKPKKASLFDEDDDLFKDDLFSGISNKKLTSNLFDDFEDIFSTNVRKKDTPKADLFSDIEEKSTTEQKNVEPQKKLDLFDSDKEEEEGDLFAVDSPRNDTVDEVKEESRSPNQASVVDEVDRSVKKVVEDLPQRQVIGAEKLAGIQKAARGLFDDSPEESDAENFFREVEEKKTQGKIDLFGRDVTVEVDKNTTESRQIVSSEPTSTSQVQAAGPKQEKPQDTDKTKSKNTIDLFGSSPPPDDDDWDTKSAPSSDNEDQFSYPVDYNAAASSLFDNEPPSLGPNESSGIVRDENATRVDTTDDSSFYPYASSSRRVSSEIYSEQQSQDSFFVTKNKTESVGVVPSLDRISEAETSSNLDITPSGKLEDFEDSQDSSTAAGDSSIFENDPPKNSNSGSKKPISLFDDSADTEDFFSSISKTSGPPKLSKKRLSLFDNIDDALQGFKEEKPSRKEADSAKVVQSLKDTESEKEKVEPTKPEETESKTVNVPEIHQKEPKKPLIGSPGKLKHNLKINVAALLPGSAPPKPRELTKSQSLDLPKEETVTPTDLSSPDLAFFTPTVSSPARDASSTGSEKALSFEDALGSVEVLHSVTKDRAKIPIKRRPSTRRGRQRAIQSTASDFTLASGDNAIVASPDTPEGKTRVEEGVPKSSPSPQDLNTSPFQTPVSDMEHLDAGILGDTVNEDVDIFSKTSSDVNSVIETTDLKVDEDFFPGAVNKSFSIFGEEKSVDDEDLFGKSTDKDVGVSSREKSIFESEDSDSELFGQLGAKKEKKEGPGKKSGGAKKRPLFNDGSSDEDLFSGTGAGDSRKKDAPKAGERKAQKSSTTRKLANIETDEDPLSSLLK